MSMSRLTDYILLSLAEAWTILRSLARWIFFPCPLMKIVWDFVLSWSTQCWAVLRNHQGAPTTCQATCWGHSNEGVWSSLKELAMKMGFLTQFQIPLCDSPGFPVRNNGQQWKEEESGSEASEDLGWGETGWGKLEGLQFFPSRDPLEQQNKDNNGF